MSDVLVVPGQYKLVTGATMMQHFVNICVACTLGPVQSWGTAYQA